MLSSLARSVFGSSNDRFIKSLDKNVVVINALEPEIQALGDAALKAKTDEFKNRIKQGEPLDKILPEAFAVVREASVRSLGMRHFDVQLIGGMVLHQGKIAEMKTGEGKTLVSTLAAYLNALEGKGVHVVTVNDYLAARDAEWMGKLYNFLGLSVGCITNALEDEQRQEQYACDITYATNNELGFDYLRDNMKYGRSMMVQRPFSYAIIDEVDSILIDEARTPLIISGPTEDNSELYHAIDKIIPNLVEADYEKEEKHKSVTLTEEGVSHVEELLMRAGLLDEGTSLYDLSNAALVHHVNQGLKAHTLFTADVDYIVNDDKVIIIDEFTGRMMDGRRFSDGLHQALEAKEKVEVQNENQTLASITFQNYFRLYPKLSGMTGTAMTEAGEFYDIYKLDVIEIPTNVPIARLDHDDVIYRTAKEKYDAVIDCILDCNAKQQPVLVGTISIEQSEFLAKRLKQEKIGHKVLNARYHEQEAYIIAQAGRPGAVTIATNMAGRGTDIMLGGNPEMMIAQQQEQKKPSPLGRGLGEGSETTESSNAAPSSSALTPALIAHSRPAQREREIRDEVAKATETVLEAGGLFVLCTERHESRRIDNQLRGRSGRQGDPGASKFFISLEDDLMRIFGATEMISKIMEKNFEEGEPLTHKWMTGTMEKAQRKVEARNYDIRKNLLKFDDVMNDQRKVIYEQRLELMEEDDVSGTIAEMRDELNEALVAEYIPAKAYADQWDTEGLEKALFQLYGQELAVSEWAKEEGIADEEIAGRVDEKIDAVFNAKEEQYGAELMRMAEKRIVLTTLDQQWKDHLLTLDHLRHGINLRAYGQRDPLNEYKQEAFELFEGMLGEIRRQVVERLARLEIAIEAPQNWQQRMPVQQMHEGRVDPAMAAGAQSDAASTGGPVAQQQPFRAEAKTGRNEPCHCGSGKKYKHCHGALT